MIRKRLLQLAAAGIIALTFSLSDYVQPCTQTISEYHYSYLPIYCSEYIAITGYVYAADDDDFRFPIPHVRLTPFARHNPTDDTVSRVGRCVYTLMLQEQIDTVYFDGEYMTEIDAIEMMNY